MGKSDGYDKNAPWYVRLSFVFHAQFLLTLKQGSGLNRKNAEKSTTDTTAKIRHHPSRGSTNHPPPLIHSKNQPPRHGHAPGTRERRPGGGGAHDYADRVQSKWFVWQPDEVRREHHERFGERKSAKSRRGRGRQETNPVPPTGAKEPPQGHGREHRGKPVRGAERPGGEVPKRVTGFLRRRERFALENHQSNVLAAGRRGETGHRDGQRRDLRGTGRDDAR